MEYISIKEFSDKVNKTPQAIYKRFFYSKQYKKYILKENGINKISIEALKLYGIDMVNDSDTAEDPKGDKEIIAILKNQLQEKDKQINNLTQAIQGLTLSNMNLNNKLLMIETKQDKGILNKLFKRKDKDTPTQDNKEE